MGKLWDFEGSFVSKVYYTCRFVARTAGNIITGGRGGRRVYAKIIAILFKLAPQAIHRGDMTISFNVMMLLTNFHVAMYGRARE